MCKHESADHLMPGDYYSNGQPFGTIEVKYEQFRCANHDCGAWLSLGNSNEKGQRVQREIFAAQIAIEVEENAFALVGARIDRLVFELAQQIYRHTGT